MHTNKVNELPDCIKLVVDKGDVRSGEVGVFIPLVKRSIGKSW